MWLISRQQILPRQMSSSTPTKHDGSAVLCAVPELLVVLYIRTVMYFAHFIHHIVRVFNVLYNLYIYVWNKLC